MQAVSEGRSQTYFRAMLETRTHLREAYAQLLGAASDDVALTTCTSEGIVRVLGALDLQPGDEVVTSDEEHPGLQGPLAAARTQRGISIRVAPFAQIADAVGPQTKLVACSHVSWVNGAIVRGLTELGDVPVLLDGAQGVGAVAFDVAEAGCAFYAGSGQKWLCGPVGSGMLWVAPQWSDRLPASGPDVHEPRRRRAPASTRSPMPGPRATTPRRSRWRRRPPRWPRSAFSATPAGPACTSARPRSPARSPRRLPSSGREVAPRDRTTLVSWKDDDPAATKLRLAEQGVIIRDLPGTGLLRASVGAWNDASDLDRLLSALA